MTKLPTGWQRVKLKDIVLPVDKANPKKDFPLSNFKYIDISGIDNAANIIVDYKKYTGEDAPSRARQKVQKGDVLFSTVRTYLKNIAQVPDDLDGEIASTGFAVIRTTSQATNRFLFFYVLTNDFLEPLNDLQRGISYPAVSAKDVLNQTIPLPPLNEQKRIVTKLDQLFAQLENVKACKDRIDKKIDTFGSICLVNPKNQQYFKRKALANYLEEGTERIGKDWPGRFKVGVSAKEGIIELSTGSKTTFEKYKVVRPGDFVYNTMRINIGSIAIYDGQDIAITSPDYIVFRIKDTLSPRLLLSYLKSERGIQEISSNTKGSVRSRLYFKSLCNINYPISPIETQNHAEAFLTFANTFSLLWENELSLTLEKIQESILTKAFRGELVPQDPNDESAQSLLEKIKRERAKLKTQKKPIKKPSKTMAKKEYESLVSALEDNKGRLTPKELWQLSPYKDDIDQFYIELKREVEQNRTIKESADKEYLELV